MNQGMMIKIDPGKLAELARADEELDAKYGKAGTPSREKFNRESLEWFRGMIAELEER